MSAESRTCVEIGSLVFAFFNCIIVFLACGVSFLGILIKVVFIFKDNIQADLASSYTILAILVSTLTLSSIALAFSTLLCIGIVKRKAHYIKAYLIYGAIVLVLIFASGVVALLVFAGLFDSRPSIIIGGSVLAVCIVYAAILGMIWATYKQCRQEIQYKHIFLVDEKFNSKVPHAVQKDGY